MIQSIKIQVCLIVSNDCLLSFWLLMRDLLVLSNPSVDSIDLCSWLYRILVGNLFLRPKSATIRAIQLPIQTHLAKTRFTTSVLPLFKLAKFVQNHQLAEICVPGAFDAVLRRISLRLFWEKIEVKDLSLN